MASPLKRRQPTIDMSLSFGKSTSWSKASHSTRTSTPIRRAGAQMVTIRATSFFRSRSTVSPRRAALTPQLRVLQHRTSPLVSDLPPISARSLHRNPSPSQIYKRNSPSARRIKSKTPPLMMSKKLRMLRRPSPFRTEPSF